MAAACPTTSALQLFSFDSCFLPTIQFQEVFLVLGEVESWFAIQSAPKAEKKVAECLTHKGYRCFLPLYRSQRKWSDRTKVLELPLFPGYVFCRMRKDVSAPIRATPGVIRIVGFGDKPYPIPDSEIESLQQIVSLG